METRHLLVLAEQNLQSSLLETQLKNLPSVEVNVCLPELAVSKSHSLSVSLTLIDYLYLERLDKKGLAPDFDSFVWPVMVHNVPSHTIDPKLCRLKMLKGVLFRDACVKHINTSVEYILGGGLWLPRNYLERIINDYRYSDAGVESKCEALTSRERQVLELMSYGISNSQIASQLFLSESTVKSHIYKLYKKLDVHSRSDAVKRVKMNGASIA